VLYLYLIQQDEVFGYDTYDSAVVVAGSEQQAREINPSGSHYRWRGEWQIQNRQTKEWHEVTPCDTWSTPEHVKVTMLGALNLGSNFKAGDVVCSSFNAG
jgi:hypothetical protein